MERIIKFRAYCHADEKDQMIVFENGQFDNGYWFNCPANIVHIDEYLSPLMQFSGLLDSKGVEIYESDIVENIDCSGIVVFDDGCFCLKIQKRLEKFNYDIGQIIPLYCFKNLEVIGNVFTHPELIK